MQCVCGFFLDCAILIMFFSYLYIFKLFFKLIVSSLFYKLYLVSYDQERDDGRGKIGAL